MFKVLGRFALLAGLACGPVAAGAVTYDCSFSDGVDDYSWITARYIITHDVAAERITVMDGLIALESDVPIRGQLVEETRGKIVFGWEVRIRDNSGQMARMKFRAVWYKAKGYMQLRVDPLGYSNSFQSRGTCVIG